ncbi:hypothetical protein [Pedobacter frigoris]|uniref:Uncharacterized protein n=1 Tax=Pedobacter frigoris TaxID=2571272 RepID=A0A4U1CHI9_9SPHI|nr:hypothetical protein [Pedobacter frigoris]TKC06057.1 hypothetical protein FA047_12040 [Pedobacter frigoris]
MKKLFFLALLGTLGLVSNSTTAQINVNVNIGSQPLWGPVGYDHVDYYYLPDVESYYYVPTREFIYLSNGKWVFASGLPSRYSSYNLYNGYKVVINSPTPYRYFSDHKVKYKKYKSHHSQPIIRNSKSEKYYVVQGHPGNNGKAYGKVKVKGNNGNGKGHGNGKGKH